MNQDTLNKIKSYKNSKYVWCAVGVILFAIFSKIVNKIYKKMRKQDAKDDGILYVTEYSDLKARIQKNYEQQKENEDFCHFLVQKKRDIENLKKQVEIISIPLVLLA